jgi:hypothetical protein
MKMCIGLILFGTLGFAETASAVPDLVWCQHCSPQQQAHAAIAAGIGTVYVGDAVNKTINAYNVYTDVDDSKTPPVRTKVADLVAPDKTLVADLGNAIKFYNVQPVGWNKHYNADVDVTKWKSVYNIINSGPNQNQFVNWTNGYAVVSADMVSLLGDVVQSLATFHLVDQSAGPGLTGTYTFSDGSHVDFTFDPVTGKLKLDPSTARDSHNNDVPYLVTDGQIHNLGGEHDFNANAGSPTDQQNFLNQLGRLAVQIIHTGNGGSPHHGWACTKSGDGPDAVWTCQYY